MNKIKYLLLLSALFLMTGFTNCFTQSDRVSEPAPERKLPAPAKKQVPQDNKNNSNPKAKEVEQAQPKTITVYRTRTGKKYHSGSCRYLNRSKIKTTLSSARTSGLTACSVCNP